MKKIGSFLIIAILFFNSCRRKAEPELFLIPDNYEGVVTVLFNREDGQKEKYVDNRRLYDIPQNGILLTKFPKTIHGVLDQQYYYKDNLGNKKSVIKDH